MHIAGVKEVPPDEPRLARVFGRAKNEYPRLSPAPEQFAVMAKVVQHAMDTEPIYTAAELATIHTPVAIVVGANDEFIKPEHTEFLASTIPDASLLVLPDVSDFAMLQRPAQFNDAMLAFLGAHGRSPIRAVDENDASCFIIQSTLYYDYTAMPAVATTMRYAMTLSELMKRPSAFVPIAMSLAALAMVLGVVALFGVPHDSDEGAAAHIFQLLLVAQLPIIAFFAIRWLPRSPSLGIRVLALQAGAGLAALAPVYFLHL